MVVAFSHRLQPDHEIPIYLKHGLGLGVGADARQPVSPTVASDVDRVVIAVVWRILLASSMVVSVMGEAVIDAQSLLHVVREGLADTAISRLRLLPGALLGPVHVCVLFASESLLGDSLAHELLDDLGLASHLVSDANKDAGSNVARQGEAEDDGSEDALEVMVVADRPGCRAES